MEACEGGFLDMSIACTASGAAIERDFLVGLAAR